MTHRRRLAAVLLLGITAACGADEAATVDTARQTSETATSIASAEGPIRAVFVDPDDPARLFVSVDCIPVPAPDAPSAVEVAEATDRVVLGIGTPVLDPPCNPVRLEVRLQAPLGNRTVVDAAGAELPVDTYVPPDPSRLVRAECTEEAARTVVANDVDGGLRSELLDCVDGWMAVLTSTDACPATGEAPGDGCIGNVHTVYWRDVDGHWTITGFDDVTTQFADNVRTCQEERLKVQSQLRHQLELARGGAPEDLGRLQNPPTPTWTLHGHIVP